MAITFDGPNKIIQLDTVTTVYSAEYIYSRWKDWVLLSDNAKYLEAFRVIGGDDLGGGATAPAFVFLRNDYGWRIQKPEAEINVTINGNLVKQDPSGGFDIPPDGSFSPSLTINLSNVASVDILGQGVEGSLDVGGALRLILAATTGKASGAETTEMRFRDVSDSKDRIIATVDPYGNREAITLDPS